MGIDWLQDSVKTVLAVSVVSAMVECTSSSARGSSSLRLICGAAAAAAILEAAGEFMKRLF